MGTLKSTLGNVITKLQRNCGVRFGDLFSNKNSDRIHAIELEMLLVGFVRMKIYGFSNQVPGTYLYLFPFMHELNTDSQKHLAKTNVK
jgi:hypothetical protein